MTEPETGKIDPELRGWQQDASPSEHRAVLLRTVRAKDPEEAKRELEAQGIQTESAGRRVIVAIVTPELLDLAAAHAWVRAVQQPQEYKPTDLLG
jgi:hypothetical protein